MHEVVHEVRASVMWHEFIYIRSEPYTLKPQCNEIFIDD